MKTLGMSVRDQLMISISVAIREFGNNGSASSKLQLLVWESVDVSVNSSVKLQVCDPIKINFVNND